MNKRGLFDVLAAGALWGFMGLFVRMLNRAGLGPFEIVQVRITVGLLVVGLFLLLRNPRLLRIRLRDLWCFLGTGIVSLLLFSICYYRAMAYVSLSTAAVLLYTAPTFVMLLSLLLFRERLTLPKLLALVLSFGGCCLVSGLGSGGSFQPVGLLLGLGAGFFYALYSIFGRYAIRRGYSSWTMVFYTFLFCALGSAFLCDWSKIGAAVAAAPSVLGWYLGLGILTGFLPYIFYSKGLERLPSSLASIAASVEPVVGTLVGVFLFHEPLGLSGLLGILLIIAAVAALSLPDRRPSHSAP